MLKFCGVALMQAAATEATKGTNSSDNNSAMSFANSSSILNLFLSFSPFLLLFLLSSLLGNIVAVCQFSAVAATLATLVPVSAAPCCALRFPFCILCAIYCRSSGSDSPSPPHALWPRPATTMCCLSDKQIRVAAAAAAPHDV